MKISVYNDLETLVSFILACCKSVQKQTGNVNATKKLQQAK